jgi:hypothetical protein
MRTFRAGSCLVSLGQEFQAVRGRSIILAPPTAPVCAAGTYPTFTVSTVFEGKRTSRGHRTRKKVADYAPLIHPTA